MQLKTRWAENLYALTVAERAKLRQWAAAKLKMRVVITIYNSKVYDKDNAWGGCKPIVDAIKEQRFIYDDSPRFLESEVWQTQCRRQERRTVIEIGVVGDVFESLL